MKLIKKYFIYITVAVFLFSNIPLANAQENIKENVNQIDIYNVENESSIIHEEEFDGETNNIIQPQIAFVIPAIAIADVVWAAAGLSAATGTVYQLWLKEPALTVEIDTAYRAIPKRLLNDDGTVDLGQFTDKIGGRTAYRNPKTGWEIDKDTAGHATKKWKLKDDKGNRKASLDGKGKIISK